MPPADLPTAEEICDFLMRFTGRDQNCCKRKWVSYGWVSEAGCKRLCNESSILECVLVFGVGNRTHAAFLVLSFCVESVLAQDGQLPPEYPGRPEEYNEDGRVGLSTLQCNLETSVMNESDFFTLNLAMVVPENTAKGSVKELVPY